MTAYVALKYGNLDDMVTVSERATDFAEDEQVCGLQAGDQLSLKMCIRDRCQSQRKGTGTIRTAIRGQDACSEIYMAWIWAHMRSRYMIREETGSAVPKM